MKLTTLGLCSTLFQSNTRPVQLTQHLLCSGSMLWYPASLSVFKSALSESMEVCTSFSDLVAESQLCLTANDDIFSNLTAS